MEEALTETYYCDYNHKHVRELAETLSNGVDDETAVAKNIFDYVRDRIPYGFDLFRRRASDTLRRGYGVCWNKSLLTVALLRCNGIPARFGSIEVNRVFCKPTAGFVYLFTNHPYHHCVAHAYLDNQWVVLDTVLDKATYESCYRPLGVGWGIDWDGINDCRLYREHVIGTPKMHVNIDETIKNRVGNKEWPKVFAIMTNAFLNRQLWKKTGCRNQNQ